MCNGEASSLSANLMHVIRYTVTSEDHKVKKLLQLFWEIVDKTHANGELKEEMLLVCNALRNDLMSPNEYVRGKTLRTLRRMPYLSIIQPLLEPIVENLVSTATT